MSKCLLCQGAVFPVLDLATLMSFKPVVTPVICERCRRRFIKISAHTRCLRCGRQQLSNQPCYDCQRWEKHMDADFKNVALYEYNAAMKSYFSEYKFRGDYRLRQVFWDDLKQAINRLKSDVVTIIPVTEATRQTRGFNQVAGLLEGLPFCDVLEFTQALRQHRQSEKSRQQRLLTTQPFRIKAGTTGHLVGKRVLVVDDVYTTGRTIRHAANLLQSAGAKTVQGLTLAHG